MARDFSRTRRVGEQIQRELAELIRDEVRDPRVGSVTVSEVSVTRDFAHARVLVTVLGASAEASADAVEALNHAAGFLRSQLARRVRLRQVPALVFEYDESFDRGARVSRLIDEAVARDDGTDDDNPDS
ncbi:Ribosome-binding factor A [wastewater metagenome]|uniref:Ribosome-binding factor A n=2 Tax=unclassified sequences TaxID=12908 RepID=A0A5B8R9P0_9ZZZZ|nr:MULTISPECIES: 30S ribosome-binding factor RbfA [Arhodomonas]MCS4504661.1 30S ribosome-binding factor RbfA [Arhodomonas aquaeolei]QEA04072.1 ribosome-binding factor A [uncultured organism]